MIAVGSLMAGYGIILLVHSLAYVVDVLHGQGQEKGSSH